MPLAHQKRTPWRISGKSDAGLVRPGNEDAFYCAGTTGGFFAVADGVGGLEYGDRASSAAVEYVRDFFEKITFPLAERPDFSALYRQIDKKIDALGDELSGGFGIATTLDIVVDGGNGTVHCAHVGDGGLFLFRDNTLVRLSEEHTMAAAEIAAGNRDFPLAYNNTLTRALGVGIECEPQVFSLKTNPGDRILAATDGVTRMLGAEKIEKILGDPKGTPESIAAKLIISANEAGGNDNSTAVVACIF